MKAKHYLLWMFTIIITSLLSFGCAISRSAVTRNPPQNAGLNRFKYVLIHENMNKRYASVNHYLDKAFTDAGLVPIKSSDIKNMELEDMLSTLICNYNFYVIRSSTFSFYNLDMVLFSHSLGSASLNSELQLELRANMWGERSMYAKLTSTLNKFYQGYDRKLTDAFIHAQFDKTFTDPSRYYEASEEDVTAYLDSMSGQLNPIEGIWSPFKYVSSDYVDNVRIAIVAVKKESYDFYGVILGGSVVWLPGEIRLKIRSTSNPSIFSVVMFSNQKAEVYTTGYLTKDGFFNLDLDENQKIMTVTSYIRNYP